MLIVKIYIMHIVPVYMDTYSNQPHSLTIYGKSLQSKHVIGL